MKPYNGHRSWNAWNVALWINNSEPVYKTCLEMIKANRSLNRIMATIREMVGNRTPDGAIYNRLSVKLAIDSLRE